MDWGGADTNLWKSCVEKSVDQKSMAQQRSVTHDEVCFDLDEGLTRQFFSIFSNSKTGLDFERFQQSREILVQSNKAVYCGSQRLSQSLARSYLFGLGGADTNLWKSCVKKSVDQKSMAQQRSVTHDEVCFDLVGGLIRLFSLHRMS